MFDPYRYEAIDWDDEDDPDGNLAHCLEHGVHESVVSEVLETEPVEVKMKVETAEFAIVGPDLGGRMWTLLFDTSFKRGDWLRPITGWPAKDRERQLWNRAREDTV